MYRKKIEIVIAGPTDVYPEIPFDRVIIGENFITELEEYLMEYARRFELKSYMRRFYKLSDNCERPFKVKNEHGIEAEVQYIGWIE